ncbi:MAG: DUF2007 domain-containing protein [Gammaproteobacteria bacterium]|nr:MAG: DUF2007 domain-containing protein [Gammaproteobacteria bacterium]
MDERVVFSSPNSLLVAHFRGLLESEGIPCRVRNEYLAGAAGELPPTECWPELCVAPRWEAAARSAIENVRRGVVAAPPWTCPACGERLEGQFSACWRCGQER